MAEYKEIKGYTIKVTDTDPIVYAGAWATGNNMNTARQYTGSFGSQTAGLVAGGETSTAVNSVEQYDGTSWTEIAEINTTRYGLEGFGNTSTSGFVVGGAPDKAETESWNGTSWTEVGDLPQGTERGGCAGTSTSAFYVGGYKYPSPAGSTNVGYDWDGSSWGTGNNINTTRDRMGAAGVVTSGIVFGGTSPGGQHAQAELYNGSAWTQTGTLNTARRELGASGFDRTNAQALGFGGEPPAVAHTESFDGSAWTEVSNLSTARAAGGGLGTSPLAAFAGGSGLSAATEEWSFPSTPVVATGQVWIKTATGVDTVMKGYQAKGTGAFATGGNLNTGRGSHVPSQQGSQTAAMAMGGATPPSVDNVEQYDGSSWSEIADINTARQGGGGAGTTTAALVVGGNGPVLIVEEWDNSSWTEVGDLNSAPAASGTATGTSSAAIRMGGYPKVGVTETWDGSSWTEVADLNNNRGGGAAVGTTTAANFAGGGYPQVANVEQWNGTAWTEIADITARGDQAAAGTQDSMLVMGGDPNTCEYWNGSSWTELADLATAREGVKGCGGSAKAIAFGGGPAVTATEEWDVPYVTKTFGTD